MHAASGDTSRATCPLSLITQPMTTSTLSSVKAEQATSYEYLSAEDVARVLGIAKTSVYDRLAHGELAHYRIGRCIRIRRDDFETFLTRTRVETRPSPCYARHPQT